MKRFQILNFRFQTKNFKIFGVLFLGFFSLALLSSCYSFTGNSLNHDEKTIQIKNFPNNAALVNANLSQEFSIALQNRFLQRSGLKGTTENPDVLIEGEITDYRITPMTATADQRAAQNRLTVTVMVRFTNRNKEDDNFEKRFSFFYDFDANQQLVGSQLTTALDVIFERITQDVFNESLAKW